MREPLIVQELAERLGLLAQRLATIKSACTNEESTKLHLILPVIAALGYDTTDPFEVYPEHAASFDAASNNRVDLAILHEGTPVIAVECKRVGVDTSGDRGQLRSYFNALPSVKLGVLTNGVTWEFFVDSVSPNIMDDEPFLAIDLETIALGRAWGEDLRLLAEVAKTRFEPGRIAEVAHVELVKKRLRTAITAQLSAPSEEFCRLALQTIGLKNVRRAQIDQHYAPMVKSAIDEAIAVRNTRSQFAETGSDRDDASVDDKSRIYTTDRELAIYGYVRRRLAFLVENERQFGAIERIDYRDYIGRLVVFFEKERKGWIFRYFEGSDGFDKFVFPAPFGEIITNNLIDIDRPLKATFLARVSESVAPRELMSRSA